MKTIITSLLKILSIMLWRKLWPFRREAVLKLRLEAMTPEQIAHIRNYLNEISTPPSVIEYCHLKPPDLDFMNAHEDLCDAIRYLNNYVRFRRDTEEESPLVKVNQKILVLMRTLF